MANSCLDHSRDVPADEVALFSSLDGRIRKTTSMAISTRIKMICTGQGRYLGSCLRVLAGGLRRGG
jgi:hypothetical protein